MVDIKEIWNQKTVEQALKLKLPFEFSAASVSIDSRTVKQGDLFIALVGENNDAHNFVASAFRSGASAAIVNFVPDGLNDEDKSKLIIVRDSFAALNMLAEYKRSISKAKFIAVTGSVGKTSTKEMLFAVFNGLSNAAAYCSFGNYNNNFGVPLSIARMPDDVKFAVFELGMNHQGEIDPLSRLVKPDVAIITTVAPVHLEFFDSVEQIAMAKAEIFVGLNKNGAAILNKDNEYFDLLKQQAGQKAIKHIVSFGKAADADLQLMKIADTASGLAVEYYTRQASKRGNFVMGLKGQHQAMNALAVLLAAEFFGFEIGKAASFLANVIAQKGRGALTEISNKDHKFFVVDDSYNASPASIKASLKVIAAQNGKYKRKIAVLGDMFELGDDAARLHRELAKEIIENKVDLVFTAGNLMHNLYAALPKEFQGGHFVDAVELASNLKTMIKNNDLILVKGSRGMRMERVIEVLRG